MLTETHLRLLESTEAGDTEIRLVITLQEDGDEMEARVNVFPVELQTEAAITVLLQNALDVLQGAAEGFEVEVVEPSDASLDEVLESIATVLAVMGS